jgi:hypothetical protein
MSTNILYRTYGADSLFLGETVFYAVVDHFTKEPQVLCYSFLGQG